MKTNVKFPLVKPLGALVQVEMAVERGTKIAIDNLRLEDCSKDFDVKKQPTPTKPPGLRAPMLSDSRYGSYWQANTANIAKYNRAGPNENPAPTVSKPVPKPTDQNSMRPSPSIAIVPFVSQSTDSSPSQSSAQTSPTTIPTTPLSKTISTISSINSVQPSSQKSNAAIIVTLPPDWGTEVSTELNLNKFVRGNPNPESQVVTNDTSLPDPNGKIDLKLA